MNHSFHPSISDSNKCAHCKFDELSHGPAAICEACGQAKTVDIVYGNMLMCADCQANERKAWTESQSPENIAARVKSANIVLESSRKIDDNISIRTDLFNAATIAIVDIIKAIDDNPAIENKPYAKAEEMKRRFDHFQQVIFDSQTAILDAGNNQRAIQSYLNQLANQLRAEERERLKIADINYRPAAVKPTRVSSDKVNRVKPKKLDKAEIRKAAAELGIGEMTLHAFILQNGNDLEKAVNKIKDNLALAKIKTASIAAPAFVEPEIVEEME